MGFNNSITEVIPSVSIDGRAYKVNLVSLKRKADFLDKYAERTEDGDLHREVIGVYYNWNAVFGWSRNDPEEYDAFFEAISAPQEFHTITVPYGRNGSHTFRAYMSNIQDDLMISRGGENYWSGLTVNFTAEAPARR